MKARTRWFPVLLGCVLLTGTALIAQETEPKADKIKPALPQDWADAMTWRSIGPASMGGRITAIAVSATDPSTYWLASASGGLLKTSNNGVTFEHQFDHEATVSIGDVQVAASDNKIVWVGTGEHNPRNSVSWGNGVYKSIDGGKTFQHMGLDKTFQIGKIAIHPLDPSIVYVGAMGRLWGPSEERGLYKTTDAGETWEKVLFVDENTGVIDVKMNPADPYSLLVATYERQRDGFDGNSPEKKWGPGSGLYKTTDGGETFNKITDGLPSVNIGRIGLDYYQADPNIAYMVLETEKIGKQPENAAFAGLRAEDVEVGARLTDITEEGPAEEAGLKVGDIVVAVEGSTVHSNADLQKEIRKRLADETVGVEISREHKSIHLEITFAKIPGSEEDEEEDSEQARRNRRRNRGPFNGGLGGQRENVQDQQGPDGHEYGGVYKSEDAGDTWTRINSVNPRPMYYSEIRVDPSDNNHIWVLGTSLYKSEDGGETFSADGAGRGVHVDHHSIWVDPNNGKHVLLGNDGGHYVTYDRGENWEHLNKFAIGQFYHVTVGPRRNYRVYGGLQDNGSWGGPSRQGAAVGGASGGSSGGGAINSDWQFINGGDGFICQVDADDPDQIYAESQGGSMSRLNLRTGERGFIRPRAPRGTRYRFNWKTPFILSSHNSRIHYSAGNFVFRSLNKGNSIKAISPEITNTDEGAGSAIAESPLDEDVLYVGTTDGAMWMTKDGGKKWVNLFDLPEEEEEETETEAESLDTQGSPSGRGDRGGAQMLERLMQRDANGDGKLQKDELPERMQGMFDRLDANSDGSLDSEEMSNMRRGGRGGQGGQGGQGRPAPEAAPAEQPAEAKEAEPQEATEEAKAEEKAEEASEEKEAETTPEQSEQASIQDVISGDWAIMLISENIPEGQNESSMTLKMDAKGKIRGTVKTFFSEGEITDGKYDPEKNTIVIFADMGQMSMEFNGKISEGKMTGSIDVGEGMFQMDYTASLTKAGAGASDETEVDDGFDWKPLNELMLEPRWVSAIEASKFEAGRVYVTFDGHRSNDDEPYVLVSENYGRTWRPLLANLTTAAGSTRVVREDLYNANLLYLGCEFSAWVSIDRGASWTKFNGNLPTVAVHEIAIHPTAGEIVAGTHGRSLWIANVTALRQMSAETIAADVHLYTPGAGIIWKGGQTRGNSGLQSFTGQNPDDGTQIYYSLGKQATEVSLEIIDHRGRTVRELEASGDAGLHNVAWDLRRKVSNQQQRPQQRRRRFQRRGPLVMPGLYLVKLTVDEQEYVQELKIEVDPDHPGLDVAQINQQELMEFLFNNEEDQNDN